MTREEIQKGSVVDLVAWITRERRQAEEAEAAASKQPELASAAARKTRPPTRLFPGAPARRTR